MIHIQRYGDAGYLSLHQWRLNDTPRHCLENSYTPPWVQGQGWVGSCISVSLLQWVVQTGCGAAWSMYSYVHEPGQTLLVQQQHLQMCAARGILNINGSRTPMIQEPFSDWVLLLRLNYKHSLCVIAPSYSCISAFFGFAVSRRGRYCAVVLLCMHYTCWKQMVYNQTKGVCEWI